MAKKRDKAMSIEEGVALREKLADVGLPLPTWTNYRKTMTGFKFSSNRWRHLNPEPRQKGAVRVGLTPAWITGREKFKKLLTKAADDLGLIFELAECSCSVTLRVFPKVCFLCLNIGNHQEAFTKPVSCPECGRMPPYTMAKTSPEANER